jgi:energy-coupling factor transporter ATP-binding protein EcfA2
MEEDGEIVPGTYELNTLFDYHALAIGIAGESAIRIEVEVMIPEGYTCAQIFELLEEKEICKAEELERYAETSQFASYWFLEGMERGHKYCLEGFLFPDTYKFYTNDTPQRIFHKMLSRFGDQFDEEMVAGIDALNERLVQMFKRNGYSEDYANAQKLTVYEVVIIASMIEKETANSGEMTFDGEKFRLGHVSHRDIARLRKKTAFVFQNYNLFLNKTALQNVTEGLIVARKMPKDKANEIARKALEKYAYPVNDELFAYTSQESAVEAVGKMLDNQVDAIFAPGHSGGLLTAYALNIHGRRIPEDISLISSEICFFSPFATPPHTTFCPEYQQLAQRTVELFKARIQGKRFPQKSIIPTRLIPRSSVK